MNLSINKIIETIRRNTILLFMLNDPEWATLHHEIVRLAAARAAQEHALTVVLLRAFHAEVWRAMGMASFYEYVEQYVGLTPRQTEERIRIAQSFEELPKLAGALAEGRLHYSGVREISRVATADTENDWISAAEGKSVGEIERMVSGRRPGDRPTDPPTAEARRRTIVLELSADAYASYREAQARLRRDSDERLSEEDGLLLMARAVLGGPTDDGRSSYQINMTLCESCGRATQDADGQVVGVDSTAAELAQCDAQRVDDAGKAAQDIPPATRRLVVRRHHGKCAVPSCRQTRFADIHHIDLRSEGGSHDPERLLLLCVAHHHAAHRGALLIEGTAAKGFTFLHADGSAYGRAADPRAASTIADVFEALTGMGFREREARWMVKEIRPHVGGDLGLDGAVRAALRVWQQGAADHGAR
jgi:hypothetical protein